MVDIGSAALARRLGVSHRRANELVRAGRIVAQKTDSGAWRIDLDSAAGYELRRARTRGLTADGAWALLFLLDGQPVPWVSESTRARLRQRIRQNDEQALGQMVAGRAGVHRFRAANVEVGSEGLLLTGRAAAQRLGSDLLDDQRHVQGYVPATHTVQSWARSHFMVPDPAGADLLYDNTLPSRIRTAVLLLPVSAVAADLAVSLDVRERRAGTTALRRMRALWLRRNG